MSDIRKVSKIIKGIRAIDGAGVKLTRVVGFHNKDDFDPFLLLDAFDSNNPDDYTKGFPWHPHRGIETITYLIEGQIEHGDSLGNKGVINSGDCQWMTAGSGIIHQEMPQASKRLLGAQLWLNLSAKDKMSNPKYGDILNKDVPVVEEDGVKIHIISGMYKNISGAFKGDYVDATYLDIELNKNSEFILSTNHDNKLFIYIIEGELKFDDGNEASLKTAVLFDNGEVFKASSKDFYSRFLLFSAKPLNEPIAWGGPIVMNTESELNEAFREIKNNTFIKHKKAGFK